MERNCRQVLGGTSGGYRCPCPYLGLAKASGLLWMTPASVLTSPRHPRYSRTLSEPTIAPTHPVSPCLHPPPPCLCLKHLPWLCSLSACSPNRVWSLFCGGTCARSRKVVSRRKMNSPDWHCPGIASGMLGDRVTNTRGSPSREPERGIGWG